MASLLDLYGLLSVPTITMIFEDPITGMDKEFAIDCVPSLTTSMAAAVTSYPVEGKGTISDHVQPQPLSLSIQGFITQSPSSTVLAAAKAIISHNVDEKHRGIGLTATFAAAAMAASAMANKMGTGSDTDFLPWLTERQPIHPDFPKNAMFGLVKMFEKGVPFRIRSFFSDSIYDNMVATSLSFPQTAKDGDSLKFSMVCQKVYFIEEFDTGVTENRIKDPANASAVGEKAKGKVKTKPTKRSSKVYKFLKGKPKE